jgi:hypothetical protein
MAVSGYCEKLTMLCGAALDSIVVFVTGKVRQRGNLRTPQEAINSGLELWRRSRTGTRTHAEDIV